MMQSSDKKSPARFTAYCAVLASLAMIFSYIDYLIPLLPAIPGIKLGLANLVILISLYTLGIPAAFIIDIVRILLTGFLFTNLTSILYSLSGAVLSLAVMCILKKTGHFSMIGVSLAGGAFHNLGQLIAAIVLISNIRLFYYYPVLITVGCLTGIFIGCLSSVLLKYLKAARLI